MDRILTLLFALALLVLLTVIYRGKMAYDKPSGKDLWAWRLAYGGAAWGLISISCALGFSDVGVQRYCMLSLSIGIALFLLGVGVAGARPKNG